MNTPKLLLVGLIGAGLSTAVLMQGAEEKEQELKTSDVPAAVQKAAQDHVKRGKIVRWEKEGDNYEAVVEKKSGRQVGIEISADGKVLGKHDESKEHKEKQ